MALANKPDGQVFGSNAKHGEVVQFPDLLRGWGIAFEQTNGIPSMEHFNYLFRRLDENQLYQLQRGIGEWQATLDYPKHALVQQEGVIYIAKIANKNKEVSSSEHWQQFGLTKADLDELLNKKADKHSPAFTGEPTAPTAPQSTNNQQIATTQFVKTAIAALVGSAPAELDTLEELAAMLAENGDLRRTLLQKIGEKAPLAHKHTTADIEGLNDALDEAGKKGVPVGAVVAFPRAIANPVGFLKCDGTSFTASLYPDLYRTLGNKNKLPDLTRSDVGMTAYFATDSIPQGWITFDSIRTQVTQSDYPELYRYLVAKYGSIASVPLAEDRFLRNTHGDLAVGQTQEDAIRNITGRFGMLDNGANAKISAIMEGPFYLDVQEKYWGFGHGNYNDNNPATLFDASRVVPTADENRPKSLALKLCIKARNSLDDIQFWVKAFGAVENAGLIDVSQLGQAIQQVRAEKADLNHKHNPDEINGLQQYIEQLITGRINVDFTQSLTDNGWQKLPNGLILQWGKMTDGQVVNFPVSFPTKCLGVYLTQITQTYKYDCSLYYYNERQFRAYVQNNDGRFLAIGF